MLIYCNLCYGMQRTMKAGMIPREDKVCCLKSMTDIPKSAALASFIGDIDL